MNSKVKDNITPADLVGKKVLFLHTDTHNFGPIDVGLVGEVVSVNLSRGVAHINHWRGLKNFDDEIPFSQIMSMSDKHGPDKGFMYRYEFTGYDLRNRDPFGTFNPEVYVAQ